MTIWRSAENTFFFFNLEGCTFEKFRDHCCKRRIRILCQQMVQIGRLSDTNGKRTSHNTCRTLPSLTHRGPL